MASNKKPRRRPAAISPLLLKMTSNTDADELARIKSVKEAARIARVTLERMKEGDDVKRVMRAIWTYIADAHTVAERRGMSGAEWVLDDAIGMLNRMYDAGGVMLPDCATPLGQAIELAMDVLLAVGADDIAAAQSYRAEKLAEAAACPA